MNVYYWRTWYKAVCGGKGGGEGHVLRDTTSRGLRGRCLVALTGYRESLVFGGFAFLPFSCVSSGMYIYI